MFQSGNHKFLKDLNRKHILNLLRIHQGLTARQLSELTNLKIATVLNLLKNLEKNNQIMRKEIGNSTKRGGKKPVIWDINPDFGLAVGVEWLSTQLRVTLINFNLQLIARKTIEFPQNLNDSQKIDFFITTINNFLSEFNTGQKPIIGLGIGLAGIIDFANGTVVLSESFQSQNLDLLHVLKNSFAFPVYLDNESNAGALGLKWLLPQFSQIKNLLYVTIHPYFSGMGTGFIFNHQLYRGMQNSTGEWPILFSDVFLEEIATQLEKIQSEHPLIGLLRNKKELSELLYTAKKLAKANDRMAPEFWRLISNPIARRLQLLINLLDPDYVIIGGDILEFNKYLAPHLKEQIFNGRLIGKPKLPGFMFSPFGTYTNALGAATTVLVNIYTQ